MATRASYVCGRIREARVAVEAMPPSQADEDLARAPFEPPLQLDGPSFFEPTQQSLDLLGGDRVRFLVRPDALHVHRGGPDLAHEAQLRDELVGPPGDDGLAGGVA